MGTTSSKNAEIINEYRKHYPEIKNEQGNNVIYYDPNFKVRPWEIYEDAELFKNETSGAFILVMNLLSLKLVMDEIKKLETKSKFDIISTGRECNEVFSLIKNTNNENIFKRGCIYTYNPDTYKELIKNYPLIKKVYCKKEEVINFLRDNAKSTTIFRTLKLITLDDYFDKVIKIHYIIARHYGNFSEDNYLKEIEKVKYFLDHPGEYTIRILDNIGQPKNQKETMLETLELYKDIESNYEKIITNYTSENCSIYKDFNYLLLRLNERGIEAFGYFISGLIYSLNKFCKVSNKGENSDITFYRGMKLDISELLNYERYQNKILCLPSFTSASKIRRIVADDIRYGGRKIKIPTRKKEGLFSVVFSIDNLHMKDAIPNGINVESISQFKFESETIFVPFSFFKVKKVKINLEDFECDIEMENINRKCIFEEKLKTGEVINTETDLFL